MDNYLCLFYSKYMFVSVILDPSSMDSAKALASVLLYFDSRKCSVPVRNILQLEKMETMFAEGCIPTTYWITINTFIIGKTQYFPQFLNGEERFLIEDLFSILGKSDANSQIESVTAFKKEFTKISAEKYEKYKKFNVLFVKLGFLSGLLIFVLVI